MKSSFPSLWFSTLCPITLFFGILETFAASEEKDECEENYTQPCEHTEFETSLSYAGLLRNVFIDKLNSSANVTKDFSFYERFLNMSGPEKVEYIE